MKTLLRKNSSSDSCWSSDEDQEPVKKKRQIHVQSIDSEDSDFDGDFLAAKRNRNSPTTPSTSSDFDDGKSSAPTRSLLMQKLILIKSKVHLTKNRDGNETQQTQFPAKKHSTKRIQPESQKTPSPKKPAKRFQSSSSSTDSDSDIQRNSPSLVATTPEQRINDKDASSSSDSESPSLLSMKTAAISLSTESFLIRLQGNLLYKNVDQNFTEVDKNNLLSKALAFYQEAERKAKSSDDKSSAAKNIALCYWKLTKCAPPPKRSNVIEYVEKGTKNFCRALQNGQQRTELWQASLVETFYRFTAESIELFISTFRNMLELVHCLRRSLVDKCSVVRLKPKLYLDIVSALQKICLNSFDKKDYNVCLYYVRESKFFIEEILRIGDEDSRNKARLLNEELAIQQAIASSTQAREIGDVLLTNALKNDDVLDLDQMCAVIDSYRKAIVECRKMCLETEAQAYSRLAVVYSKILKCDSHAKECAGQVFSLVKSMGPKNFYDLRWFCEAAEVLERFQTEERLLREEQRWVNKRTPFVRQLKTELSQINILKNDRRTFLKFIYQRFPPKHKVNAMLRVNPMAFPEKSAEMRRLLKMAMIHYHPDGVNEDSNGMKHKVLCEEIYKVISGFYEFTKRG